MWPTFYIPIVRRVEGEPPPRFYLTTPPYPFEFYEECTTAADIDSVTPGISVEDAATTSARFVGGELVTRLRTQDGGSDEVETTIEFVGGVLTTRLKTYDNRNDQVKTTMMFVSGAMTDPLVTYLNWPLAANQEDIITQASFVSGVLT